MGSLHYLSLPQARFRASSPSVVIASEKWSAHSRVCPLLILAGTFMGLPNERQTVAKGSGISILSHLFFNTAARLLPTETGKRSNPNADAIHITPGLTWFRGPSGPSTAIPPIRALCSNSLRCLKDPLPAWSDIWVVWKPKFLHISAITLPLFD